MVHILKEIRLETENLKGLILKGPKIEYKETLSLALYSFSNW
jgi:hypothetical protein